MAGKWARVYKLTRRRPGEVKGQPHHMDQQQGVLRDVATVGHEAEQDSVGGEQDTLGSG